MQIVRKYDGREWGYKSVRKGQTVDKVMLMSSRSEQNTNLAGKNGDLTNKNPEKWNSSTPTAELADFLRTTGPEEFTKQIGINESDKTNSKNILARVFERINLQRKRDTISPNKTTKIHFHSDAPQLEQLNFAVDNGGSVISKDNKPKHVPIQIDYEKIQRVAVQTKRLENSSKQMKTDKPSSSKHPYSQRRRKGVVYVGKPSHTIKLVQGPKYRPIKIEQTGFQHAKTRSSRYNKDFANETCNIHNEVIQSSEKGTEYKPKSLRKPSDESLAIPKYSQSSFHRNPIKHQFMTIPDISVLFDDDDDDDDGDDGEELRTKYNISKSLHTPDLEFRTEPPAMPLPPIPVNGNNANLNTNFNKQAMYASEQTQTEEYNKTRIIQTVKPEPMHKSIQRLKKHAKILLP